MTDRFIFGNDDRTTINRPFLFPYSTVTTIDVATTTTTNEGTGTLILPNHVLTVAHNVIAENDLRVTTSLLNSRNLNERSNFEPPDPPENVDYDDESVGWVEVRNPTSIYV